MSNSVLKTITVYYVTTPENVNEENEIINFKEKCQMLTTVRATNELVDTLKKFGIETRAIKVVRKYNMSTILKGE